MNLFKVDEKAKQFIDSLSERQRRLIVGAINYHSLTAPSRTLQYQVYMGQKWQYPRLADFSVFNGVCTKSAGLKPIFTFSAQSTVTTQSEYTKEIWNEGKLIQDNDIRYLLLTPDDATDDDVMNYCKSDTLKQRIYKECELYAPSAFDIVREALRRKREYDSKKSVLAYNPWNQKLFEGVANSSQRSAAKSGKDCFKNLDNKNLNNASKTNGVPNFLECVPPAKRVEGAKKAVIIGVHWLQAGGAERWAVETIRIAKKAGFLPIVIADRDSHHPWITKDFCDDALILPLTPPAKECWGDVPLLRSLFEQFDIRGIAIHHCQWIYDHIWWVKKFFPNTHIVDSLHIVEYINRGGYPHEALTHDNWIDLHHVISPQLENWLHNVHGIESSKIIDAPLIGLTTSKSCSCVSSRKNKNTINVAFVGRIARQKRPEAFVLVAKALNKKYPGKFHFILHGDGDLDTFVTELISRYHLENVIERRSMSVPAQKTYDDADVLLISSVNEGITLTTIEALSCGVPVLSTNVGSQKTVIPSYALLPRMTSSFVKASVKELCKILEDDSYRSLLWKEEVNNLSLFAKLESAETLFTKLFEEWSK
ncbi:glycosyl transferase [Gardnerella vaginalis]|uniref:Glycosyl transferase n=1 Tax=Gardnerella pickettii TaxID=2914924 RepID=A0ABX4SFX3_9BIFI|nr:MULTISPECIES: glycosyltransferase [Gardnerella]PKZ52895.1 glycosyl transferase [Gardnerella pickettii]RDW96314.1 glycosyl transferase [Gardnerella vaginalis]RDW98529.1 glycosyl transferase [Gardnerella vaginalis]